MPVSIVPDGERALEPDFVFLVVVSGSRPSGWASAKLIAGFINGLFCQYWSECQLVDFHCGILALPIDNVGIPSSVYNLPRSRKTNILLSMLHLIVVGRNYWTCRITFWTKMSWVNGSFAAKLEHSPSKLMYIFAIYQFIWSCLEGFFPCCTIKTVGMTWFWIVDETLLLVNSFKDDKLLFSLSSVKQSA